MTPAPIRYAPLAARLPEGDVDLSLLIEGSGPVELEIGFGRGRFLLERARAAPEARIIGIEIKPKWAHWVEERRKREGLGNALALCGDARVELPRCTKDRVLARMFMHFPDPWWKKRHAKRRVLDEDFLAQAARLLVDRGELFVQTDVPERAHDMRTAIAEYGAFEVVECSTNLYGARSNREARADEDGLPYERILARRVPR